MFTSDNNPFHSWKHLDSQFCYPSRRNTALQPIAGRQTSMNRWWRILDWSLRAYKIKVWDKMHKGHTFGALMKWWNQTFVKNLFVTGSIPVFASTPGCVPWKSATCVCKFGNNPPWMYLWLQPAKERQNSLQNRGDFLPKVTGTWDQPLSASWNPSSRALVNPRSPKPAQAIAIFPQMDWWFGEHKNWL